MPLTQQAKLLRVLEEKKVNRVGTHNSIEVNVRVIAASNQKLEELSEENKFRLDLYHRLSSFIIHIPPLRERKDDIPVLFDHFIKEISLKIGKSNIKFDPRIYKILEDYRFPGNVRELKNIVERALIICEDEYISMENFSMIAPNKSKSIIAVQSKTEPITYDLEEAEKKLIIKALEKVNNNKSKAAELLNITWQSLDRRMKKFKL